LVCQPSCAINAISDKITHDVSMDTVKIGIENDMAYLKLRHSNISV
jgi:hypothetical protein